LNHFKVEPGLNGWVFESTKGNQSLYLILSLSSTHTYKKGRCSLYVSSVMPISKNNDKKTI